MMSGRRTGWEEPWGHLCKPRLVPDCFPRWGELGNISVLDWRRRGTREVLQQRSSCDVAETAVTHTAAAPRFHPGSVGNLCKQTWGGGGSQSWLIKVPVVDLNRLFSASSRQKDSGPAREHMWLPPEPHLYLSVAECTLGHAGAVMGSLL